MNVGLSLLAAESALRTNIEIVGCTVIEGVALIDEQQMKSPEPGVMNSMNIFACLCPVLTTHCIEIPIPLGHHRGRFRVVVLLEVRVDGFEKKK